MQKPSASDSTKALLALFQDAGLHGSTAAWTATTHASLAESQHASSSSLQVDKFEPDPRNRNAMLRGPAALVPFWTTSENSEMDGLKRRGCIKRVHRQDLSAARVVPVCCKWYFRCFALERTKTWVSCEPAVPNCSTEWAWCL